MRQDRLNFSFSRNNKNPNLFTDINKSYGSERKRLKALFIESDKNQASDYIKDLESTIAINKELIAEMLKSQGTPDSSVNQKLNLENARLLKQVAELTRKQTDTQAQLLMTEQIMKEHKMREEETRLEFEEKRKEFVGQLSKKEYILQHYEKKNRTLEELLGKFAKKEPELSAAMRELETNLEPRFMESVVTENTHLSKKLAESQGLVKELQAQLCVLATENKRQAGTIEELSKVNTKKTEISVKVPSFDLGRMGIHLKTKSSETLHVHKLEETIKAKNVEIALLNSKIEALQKNVKKLEASLNNLFEVNERLNNTLKEVGDKFNQKKNFNKTGTLQINGLLGRGQEEDGGMQMGKTLSRPSSTKQGKKLIQFEKPRREKLRIADFLKQSEKEKKQLLEPQHSEFNDISSIEKPLPSKGEKSGA